MSRTSFIVKEPPRLHYNKFFAAIHGRPALWDSRDKDFDNTEVTHHLWNEVAKICGKYKGAHAQIEFLR
ncbi:hypothetical protein PMAYCL1PPCAC_24986, partial [Pristionchus mayeri]